MTDTHIRRTVKDLVEAGRGTVRKARLTTEVRHGTRVHAMTYETRVYEVAKTRRRRS